MPLSTHGKRLREKEMVPSFVGAIFHSSHVDVRSGGLEWGGGKKQ
jgi:hypothetical protein